MLNVHKKHQRNLTIDWRILLDEKLRPVEKLILSEIMRLSGRRGYCWAGNDYFANRLGIGQRTASRAIADLLKNKHIEMKLAGYKRKLFPRHRALAILA